MRTPTDWRLAETAENDMLRPLSMQVAQSPVKIKREEHSMSGTAKATVHVENDRVIVTEYRFAPGANTGWHRHGHDYVVVPLMDGRVKLETANGTSFADMKAGVPYFRSEGVEHDVINANDTEYAFIEIELK
jgi:beta-alanine degradation protein BauB